MIFRNHLGLFLFGTHRDRKTSEPVFLTKFDPMAAIPHPSTFTCHLSPVTPHPHPPGPLLPCHHGHAPGRRHLPRHRQDAYQLRRRGSGWKLLHGPGWLQLNFWYLLQVVGAVRRYCDILDTVGCFLIHCSIFSCFQRRDGAPPWRVGSSGCRCS